MADMSAQLTLNGPTRIARTMIPPGRAPPVPHPGFIYTFVGKALGASMWFFVRLSETRAA